MSRTLSLVLVGAALAPLAAQPLPPVTPPWFTIPGSQANQIGAALVIQGNLIINGAPASPFSTVLDVRQESVTAPWSLQSLPGAVVEMNLQGRVETGGFQPFTLAVSITPGVFPGSNFLPWMPSSVNVPGLGIYHLGAMPLPLLDGIGVLGPAHPLAVTDGTGMFPLNGLVNLNQPDHIAIQGLLLDPSAMSGLRFTAALSIPKHQ